MAYLIDLFTPSDLLHFVTVANKYKILSTEDKRYLIALRMSAAWVDGEFRTDDDKKNRFYRVFSQFLKDLGPGQGCERIDCATCARVQHLRDDFHGAQKSEEFMRFLRWFQNGGKVIPMPAEEARHDVLHAAGARSRVGSASEDSLAGRIAADVRSEAYVRTGADARSEGDVRTGADAYADADVRTEAYARADADVRTAADVGAHVPANVDDPAGLETIPSHDQQAAAAEPTIVRGAFESIPLFQFNLKHPLIANFAALADRDLSMLDNDDLRRHSLALARAGQHLLELMGWEADDQDEKLDAALN